MSNKSFAVLKGVCVGVILGDIVDILVHLSKGTYNNQLSLSERHHKTDVTAGKISTTNILLCLHPHFHTCGICILQLGWVEATGWLAAFTVSIYCAFPEKFK